MELTKVDSYDYTLIPGVVQVSLEGTNDPTLVDILSELDRSNGRLYVEGQYFLYTGYDIVKHKGSTFLNLSVTTIN